MEPDSSSLKEEIARLHAIIDVLIAHNKVLQAETSCLKSENAPPDSFSSHVNFEKGNIDVFSSHEKIEKGSIQPDNSNEKTNIGRTDAYSAYDTIIKGSKGVFSSHEKIETGRTGSWNHLSKTDTGRNDALRPLPDFVEPTPTALARLAHLLNASGVTKVRRSTLNAMALIIVQAHNKQDCSHNELRKLIGHSEGGIAKLLIAMKKHGLIHRAGFKRFALSAPSQEMLRQAVAS